MNIPPLAIPPVSNWEENSYSSSKSNPTTTGPVSGGGSTTWVDTILTIFHGNFGSKNGGRSSLRKMVAKPIDIYWLGITMVIGGQIIVWCKGLAEGFWMFFSATCFIGVGYLVLTLCIAEMTSMLPFAGGSYGYARCALGLFPGYIIGCCESLAYILYVCSAVVEFGKLITSITNVSSSYEPLYWLLFYVLSLAIQVRGGSFLWGCNAGMGCISLLLIVIYICVSIPHVDFEQYALEVVQTSSVIANATMTETVRPTETLSTFGTLASFNDFMFYFPLASWFYVGVEAMTLSAKDINKATVYVPWAMTWVIVTLIITSIAILFTSASLYPGIYELSKVDLPLNYGYSIAFNISTNTATIFALPGTFATAFGFMFAYGRQLSAMAQSGLLPQFFAFSFGYHKTPMVAYVIGSMFGYFVLLLLWYLYPNGISYLFNICMLNSCVVYVGLLYAYLICKVRYLQMPREFTSPFGLIGALYGMFLFGYMAIALCFFQRDKYVAMAVVTFSCLLMTWYYFSVVKERELFSLEEQEKFMQAYILNAQQSGHSASQRNVNLLLKKSMLRVAPEETTIRISHRSRMEYFDQQKPSSKQSAKHQTSFPPRRKTINPRLSANSSLQHVYEIDQLSFEDDNDSSSPDSRTRTGRGGSSSNNRDASSSNNNNNNGRKLVPIRIVKSANPSLKTGFIQDAEDNNGGSRTVEEEEEGASMDALTTSKNTAYNRTQKPRFWSSFSTSSTPANNAATNAATNNTGEIGSGSRVPQDSISTTRSSEDSGEEEDRYNSSSSGGTNKAITTTRKPRNSSNVNKGKKHPLISAMLSGNYENRLQITLQETVTMVVYHPGLPPSTKPENE